MVVTLVQDKYAEVGFFETVVLDSPPTPGNVLIAWSTQREQDALNAPNGFEPHPDGMVSAGADSGKMWLRVVEAGDSATLTGFQPGSMTYVSEWSGVDSYEWGPATDDDSSGPLELLGIDAAGSGIVLGGFVWRTDTDFAAETVDPTGDTVELNDHKTGTGFVYHPLNWVAYTEAPSAGTYDVTGDPQPSFGVGMFYGAEALILYAGGDLPEPPPVDPGDYEPPEPGHAILEIYVHDEDATRWGTATWSADLTPTGTEGIWSGAGWQDVTPEGLRAHVIWGTSRPERGILAEQEAQSWYVETYDPERRLDPGNVDSPFYPQLVSGVPIRISHATSGLVIRTGVIDRIRYAYKAPEYNGKISASSTIAILHRAEVPDGSVLGDTLRERIQDAVTASGIAIGGIPITGFDDSYPDIPISTRPDTEPVSVWEVIRKAGEETLWLLYEDNAGTLQARPYTNPVDRGREITYANLEDLEAESSEDGVYSLVRVTNADGSAVIERVAAPLPRYGRRPYVRQDRTIDPEGWADALLADRAWPGITWTPGVIWCWDATEVAYFAGLEIMERVGILVPGVLNTSGKLLGMELWVEARTETRSRWLFLPKLATDGSTAPGGADLLIADDDGSFLVADDDASVFLEADG